MGGEFSQKRTKIHIARALFIAVAISLAFVLPENGLVWAVDTAPPNVTLISPANNSNQSSFVTFNFTATDDQSTSMAFTLFINGTANLTGTIANGTFNVTTLAMADGLYNWSVSVNDSANNTGNSPTNIFRVDGTAPVVTLISPVNDSNFSTTSITFSFKATDDSPSETFNFTFYLDGVANLPEGFMFNNTVRVVTVAGIPDGLHSWFVNVSDFTKNTGMSETRFFRVNPPANQPPVANAGPDQTVNDSNGNGFETVVLNGSLSFDPDGVIINFTWLANGDLNAPTIIGVGEVINASFSVGVHNVTLNVTDDDGASDVDQTVVTVVEMANLSSWAYKANVTITNNNASTPLPTGYTVRLTFDHASLVSANQSLASGDDVRVVYNGATELDRINVTAFNTGTTAILFRTQASIPAGGGASNYEVYYGNPGAGAPPANKANVYLVWDDFDSYTSTSDPAFTDKWYHAWAQGSSAIENGQLSMNASSPVQREGWAYKISLPSNIEVSFDYTKQSDSTEWYLDYQVRREDYTSAVDCFQTSGIKRNCYWHQQDTLYNVLMSWNGSTLLTTDQWPGGNTAGVPVKVAIRVFESHMTYYQDGTLDGSLGVNHVAPGYFAMVAGYQDLNGKSHSHIDNVKVRKYIEPEPSTSAPGLPTPANTPPVANAGPDQTVNDTDNNGSETVTLNGSLSFDPDGVIINFTWLANGDLNAPTLIGTGEVINASFSVGVHNVTLNVTDDDGASDTDSMLVTVNAPVNQPPVANAGPDQTVNDTDNNGFETVVLNGSLSFDPDGVIVNYSWKEGATLLGVGAVIPVNLSVGIHNITLNVTDDDGASSLDLTVVTVNAPANQPPVAEAGPGQVAVDTDNNGFETVTLNGSGSYDPDGVIVNYTWREGLTLLGIGAVIPINFSVGTHYVILNVTDDDGATDVDQTVVTVVGVANLSSWAYHANVTITNNNASTPLPTGYTVRLTFDHAALVSANQSLASGDDVRVVHNGATELDRINVTAFNTGTTAILFRTQASIPAGGGASNYEVYYGNPSAGVPPADPNNVYLLYDDFTDNNGSTPNSGIWDYQVGTNGYLDIQNNQLRSYSDSSGSDGEVGTSWVKSKISISTGFSAVVDLRSYSSSQNTFWSFFVKNSTNSTFQSWGANDYAGAIRMRDGTGPAEGNFRVLENGTQVYTEGGIGTPHTLKMLFDGSTAYAYVDDNLKWSGPWSLPAEGAKVWIGARGGGSPGEFADARWDNAVLRRYLAPEPSTSAPGLPTQTNTPPVANAGPDQTVNDTDNNGFETVTLNGSGSYDPDGVIVNYTWREGLTLLGIGAVIPINFSVGTHNVTLNVTDDDGASSLDYTTITVNAVDIAPPIITITSPQNTTYANATVWLNVSANEPISLWQYSLNGAPNVTFTPNTTFTAAEGANTITVTANDTAGNRNTTSISFTVDTTPPLVTVLSPINTTYTNNSVWVNVTLNEMGNNVTAQLDSTTNYTLINSSGNWNRLLTGLGNGAHSVRIFANDSLGNMNSSAIVYFIVSVDTTPPTITIYSPQNITYQTTYFDLNFTAVDASGVEWTGYRFDGGPLITSGNATFYENNNGRHNITVYANDSLANQGSSTVYFTTDVPVIVTGLTTNELSYAPDDRVNILANVANLDNVSHSDLQVNFLVWDPDGVLVHNDTDRTQKLNSEATKRVSTRFSLAPNATLGNYTVEARLSDPANAYDIKRATFQVA